MTKIKSVIRPGIREINFSRFDFLINPIINNAKKPSPKTLNNKMENMNIKLSSIIVNDTQRLV